MKSVNCWGRFKQSRHIVSNLLMPSDSVLLAVAVPTTVAAVFGGAVAARRSKPVLTNALWFGLRGAAVASSFFGWNFC